VSLFGEHNVLSIVGVIPQKRAFLLVDIPRRGTTYTINPSRPEMREWCRKLVRRLNEEHGEAVAQCGEVCSEVVVEHMYGCADLVLSPHTLVGTYWALSLGMEVEERERPPLVRHSSGFIGSDGSTVSFYKSSPGEGIDFEFIFKSPVAADWPISPLYPCPCDSGVPFGACHFPLRCPFAWASRLDGFTL